MSSFCIHEKTWGGSRYEPPEAWCELSYDECGENCPYRYSGDDFEDDRIDYEYDKYRDDFFFNF